MDDTERFVRLVSESGNIVFFGGAGVSTESGIPDFRSVDGLYSQKYDYPPEQMLSHSFFMAHPDEFYRFYRDKLIVRGVKPNITHIKLAGLERAGKLRGVAKRSLCDLGALLGRGDHSARKAQITAAQSTGNIAFQHGFGCHAIGQRALFHGANRPQNAAFHLQPAPRLLAKALKPLVHWVGRAYRRLVQHHAAAF